MEFDLSIIVPVFNEEGNINELYRRLNVVLAKITPKYEIVFINDGSSDDSLSVLKKIRQKDIKVKILSFSRNFGHMSAIEAGLKNADGKKIVIMDADLQDPPEIIPKMYSKSLEGYKVVYGIKRKRQEGFLKRIMFKSFYRILNKISSYKMPLDAGTFSLIDSSVSKILISLPERNKYFSGLRAWTGFSQTGITYERGSRFSGKPISFSKLVKLALDGLVSFSYVPLRAASVLGFIFASLAFIMIILVIIGRVYFKLGLVGWASTMSSILLIGGVQLITLGIIGEYLARIYDEVKNRPQYIISEKIGFRKK